MTDYLDARVQHTMAEELAELAWQIHQDLVEASAPAAPSDEDKRPKKIDYEDILAARVRLAELASMLTDRAAAIDPLRRTQ